HEAVGRRWGWRPRPSVAYHASPGRASYGAVRLSSTALGLLHDAASRRTSSALAPETSAGDGSTFDQRPQLRPHHTLGHEVPSSVGTKATIRTGNHPAPIPHGVDGLAEAIGHHFRMFDIVSGRIDHARQEEHRVR